MSDENVRFFYKKYAACFFNRELVGGVIRVYKNPEEAGYTGKT